MSIGCLVRATVGCFDVVLNTYGYPGLPFASEAFIHYATINRWLSERCGFEINVLDATTPISPEQVGASVTKLISILEENERERGHG
ncbi:hypothetical protein LCGC14_2631550 [marine sediment metagenome]|uniref:Uncharacterized protein n=1 Tax=marine sediment metagenome TaxID=412755 RepID=A0A0F9A0B1_9ZZZZ